MKQVKLLRAKLEPAARLTLVLSGALQATVAAVAIATRTTSDVSSILFMVLGGVGLAFVALAVSDLWPDCFPQRHNENCD